MKKSSVNVKISRVTTGLLALGLVGGSVGTIGVENYQDNAWAADEEPSDTGVGLVTNQYIPYLEVYGVRPGMGIVNFVINVPALAESKGLASADWGLDRIFVATPDQYQGVTESRADAEFLTTTKKEDWMGVYTNYPIEPASQRDFLGAELYTDRNLLTDAAMDVIYYGVELVNLKDEAAEPFYVRGKVDLRDCVHAQAFTNICKDSGLANYNGVYDFSLRDRWGDEEILTWEKEKDDLVQRELVVLDNAIAHHEQFIENGYPVAATAVSELKEKYAYRKGRIAGLGRETEAAEALVVDWQRIKAIAMTLDDYVPEEWEEKVKEEEEETGVNTGPSNGPNTVISGSGFAGGATGATGGSFGGWGSAENTEENQGLDQDAEKEMITGATEIKLETGATAPVVETEVMRLERVATLTAPSGVASEIVSEATSKEETLVTAPEETIDVPKLREETRNEVKFHGKIMAMGIGALVLGLAGAILRRAQNKR